MMQPLLRIHSHVVVGAGDNELVGLEVFVKDHLASLRAFHPEIVRYLALRCRQQPADLRADNVVDPIHSVRLLVGLCENVLTAFTCGARWQASAGCCNLAPHLRLALGTAQKWGAEAAIPIEPIASAR